MKLSPAQEDMLERLRSGKQIYRHRDIGSFQCAYVQWFYDDSYGKMGDMRTFNSLLARGLLKQVESDYTGTFYTAKEQPE